jgi:hypothetical protein
MITSDNWTTYKGQMVNVTLTDGTVLTGSFVSINSKGVNVQVGDKLVSRSMSRVASIDNFAADITDDLAAIDLDLEDDADELEIDIDDSDSEDGHTTAELAAMFDTSTRALRVNLRKLGLGVGRGRRYHLTDDELATVRQALKV